MINQRFLKSSAALLVTLLIALLISACDEQNRPVRGFVLPQGNIDRGKQVFIDQGCYKCHTIPTVELPDRGPDPPITLAIGGKVYRVRNYGELLDAIVSPNHIISAKYRMAMAQEGHKAGESPMPNFNEQLTVSDLIDLVAFLHAQYSKMEPPDYQGYPGFR